MNLPLNLHDQEVRLEEPQPAKGLGPQLLFQEERKSATSHGDSGRGTPTASAVGDSAGRRIDSQRGTWRGSPGHKYEAEQQRHA